MRKEIRLLVEGFFDDDIFNVNDINQDIQDIGDRFYSHQFFPKNKDELRKLLEQLLEERGPNANLNDIDTSEITDMSYLFSYLNPHNIDISNWDVGKVTDMSYMFCDCNKFTGQGLENWKPIKCKDMSFMFDGCSKFNSDLSSWNVSKVICMESMFENCAEFTGKGLETWKPKKCENFFSMFDNCISLKIIPNWYKF